MNIYEIISEQASTTASSGILLRLKNYYTVNQLAKTGAAASKLQRVLGGSIRFIKLLGFLPLAQQHFENVVALEDMVKKKTLSEEDFEAARRQEIEEMVLQIMTVAAFTKILQWILRFRILMRIPQALGAVASVLTGGALAGGELMLILGTEAASIWIQQNMTKPEWQKALSYCVMYAIDPGVVWLYNEGPGKFLGQIKTLSPQGAQAIAANPKLGPNVVGGTQPEGDPRDSAPQPSSLPKPGYDPFNVNSATYHPPGPNVFANIKN